MRAIFGVGMMLAVLAACTGETAKAPTPEVIAQASADLTAYLDAEYEEELQFSPQEMTSQGRKDKYGELDDRSEAGAEKVLDWRRQSVADMKAKFTPDVLNEEARLSYEIWELELDRAEKSAQYRRHRYIFGRNGAHTGLVNFLITQHRVDEKSDMDAYISRVGAIGTALDQLLERAKLAAADGVRMPGFAYDQTTSEVKRVTAGFPFDTNVRKPSALFEDASKKIDALVAASKTTPEEANQLKLDVAKAMKDQMKPAYDRLAAWVAEDKKNASAQPQGVSALPDGVNYYNTMLYLQTTTTMTAEEIHALGLSEVARLRGEMETVKEQAGFKGTLAEFFVFMRTDKQFYLPSTNAGAAQYIKSAEDYTRRHGSQAAGVFRDAAEGAAAGEARRGVPRGAGRRAALSGGDAGWLAAGHVLRASFGHDGDADLPAREHHLSRGRSGPSHADLDPAGADRAAEVPHAVWLYRVLGRVGPLHRGAVEGDGIPDQPL